MEEVLEYYGRVARVMDREPRPPGEERFWRRESRRTAARRALDLGCGSARIAEHLAAGSRRVLGIDLSPHMLARARSRTADAPGILLARGDVRSLPLRPGWGLAAAANGLFSHLLSDDGRQRALEEIARVLSPSGRFLLEGLWLPRPAFRQAARGGWTRRSELADPATGTLEEVRQLWRCDPETRVCRVRFAYGPRDAPSRISAEFRARVWAEGEVESRFGSAGLRVRDRWGDFRRGEFSPDRSHRLIVAAERT